MAIVYLLHFTQVYEPYPDAEPYKCAGHYTGSVRGGPKALRRRLRQHGTERGAKLMIAVAERGIRWVLARTWAGGYERERQLKRQGGARRRCPLCGVCPAVKLSNLPRTKAGSLAHSLINDGQRHAIGAMTTFERNEHKRLRHDLIPAGRVHGVTRTRGALPHCTDPWYTDSHSLRPASALPRPAGNGHHNCLAGGEAV